MSERGYPEGTLCVVTQANESTAPIGKVVKCGGLVCMWWAGESVLYRGIECLMNPNNSSLNGYMVQEVGFEIKPNGVPRYFSHPTTWMRPIDADTDESDEEIVQAYKQVKQGEPVQNVHG